MIDSRCGLCCAGCSFRDSHGCGGCIETMGHPFHGACPIALCCQEKHLAHCGECDGVPCDNLYAYCFSDKEHGDMGARILRCREEAAQGGHRAWENVLLTSAGFEDSEGRLKLGLVDRFVAMLAKPIGEAKILFIPTAAIDDESKMYADWCRAELLRIGANEALIHTHELGARLSESEAMDFDVIYFTGGCTNHLLSRLRETGFDQVVKKMVFANKLYVGVSAGSLIAGVAVGGDRAALCFVHAYLGVHCAPDATPREDLPLPEILLTDDQALVVRWDGYELVER